MKDAIVDIGELGWSLYLSAHARWMKKNGQAFPLVMTHPERGCLYRGLVDEILPVPPKFYVDFKKRIESCTGLEGVPAQIVRDYFNRILAPDYTVYHGIRFRCRPNWSLIFKDRKIFEPYPYENKLSGNKEILIFPRWMKYKKRNIPREFYRTLILALCIEFPNYRIRTMGTLDGAHTISSIPYRNYVNWIGMSEDVQDLIDRCQVAKVAIGSQSAPPKISLLQGVPTFIIGNERIRHVNSENWMRTKIGFYDVHKDSYYKFDFEDCEDKIISFIKECE